MKKGTWLGGLKTIVIHSIFYVNLANFGLVALTAYNTTIKPYLAVSAPWFTLPVFVTILLIFTGLAMFLEYKYVYPSYIRFQNQQEWEHQNLIREELAKIKEEIIRELVANRKSEKNGENESKTKE